ncbi:SDR family NAD(P)-dependent oxidoreductase [Mycetocola sp.]|uniref:SDR family NAD(P)-dependent oxidoreductase n=1 Tax=Mycetocola sp. TaxID=1871042 RepID=UPI003989FCB5
MIRLPPDECEELGGRALAVPTDVTDANQVDALASRAVDEFGRIDVWVNNAAVSVFAPFLEMPIGDLRRVSTSTSSATCTGHVRRSRS